MLNDKLYIGQTVRPKQRWSQHKTYAKRDNPVQYIHRAMMKYGIDNFQFMVIAGCKTSEDANETEKLLIKQYDSKREGYNVSPGGDVPWNKNLPTEKQPMYGKHHSESVKQKNKK